MDSFTPTQIRILLLCCALYVVSFFNRLCPVVLAGDISVDLGISSAQLGMFSGVTMLAYGLMQLPSGLLADALGGKKTLTLLAALSGVCVLWVSLSDSISQLLAARFLMGLGAAITVPAMVLLAAHFPPQMYARACSFLLCSGGIGSLLASSPLAYASELFGWRVPILFAGVLTLALAGFIWVGIKEKPDHIEKVETMKASLSSIVSGTVGVFKTPRFWPLALWLMAMPGIYFLFAGLWWGPYLVEGNGLGKLEASYIISSGAVAILLGQPLLGYLSDRVFKNRRILLITGALSSLLAALMMLFLTGQMSVPLLVVQGLLFIMGTNAAPIAFTMLKESFPPHMVGTAIGCANLFYPVWSAVLQNCYGILLDWRLDNGCTQSAAFADTAYIYIFHCLFALVMALLTQDTFRQSGK